ncbi:non-homologous end-joining DNA ligase [Streptomyces sp. NPDC050560]|uniref:non-homologous end-joining DNA ligase n=1 Tax=Streptomyces sp. NPDC050560 TaxID=3365630 RepID=UPI00379F6369
MTPITEVEGRRIPLSNLEKVIYPGPPDDPGRGFTKGEVLHYYASVAGPLLAQLRDRPVSFLRYPDGPGGQRFFTKNVPPGTPEWVSTAEVPHSDGPARQVMVQDLPSLMWAANLVTEFHAPQWRAPAPPRADRMVFDLDPGAPATVVDCCRVALWLRERLADDGLHAVAKTSGSKGLHLLVSLAPAADPAAVTAYARRLAVAAERALPGLVTHRMTRSLRPGRVFVDFSQNAAAKTTAVAYTLRVGRLPLVSAPVGWAEVEGCGSADALAFTAAGLPARIDREGDPLASLDEHAAPLPA